MYFLGQYLVDEVVREFDLVMHVRSEPTFHRLIMTASAIYVALMSIPFMPAAEIGISLIVFFGPRICFLVYVCTVTALSISYLVGRLIPIRYCAHVFGFLGLSKARQLIEKIDPLTADERATFLIDHAPTRFGSFLTRHRYLALAVVLNVPGNMVIGGGGGIAMLAGMTGIYSAPAYFVTVMVAVAPLPLLIALVGPTY